VGTLAGGNIMPTNPASGEQSLAESLASRRRALKSTREVKSGRRTSASPSEKPYSAFKHLWRSVIPYQDRERLMAMFTVYLDESGTHDKSKAVVVAGCIATVNQWTFFEREWREMLEREGISIFHRNDLENFKGEFKEEYGWNPARRARVVRLAQGIIKRRTNYAICSAVIKRDYDEIIMGEMRDYYGRHYYTFCVNDALRLVGNWIRKFSRTEPLNLVFESGAEGIGEVMTRLAEISRSEKLTRLYNFASGTFAKKQDLVQLQAADLWAYETFKQMDNRIVDGVKRKVRKSAEDLINCPHASNYWRKEDLLNLVSDYQERKKRGQL
jgi:hypothetical protein